MSEKVSKNKTRKSKNRKNWLIALFVIVACLACAFCVVHFVFPATEQKIIEGARDLSTTLQPKTSDQVASEGARDLTTTLQSKTSDQVASEGARDSSSTIDPKPTTAYDPATTIDPKTTTAYDPASISEVKTTTSLRDASDISLEIPVCSGTEYGKTHEIVRHENYALCYCEKFEQPEWVAYELTQSELEKVASRKNNFHADPAVSTGSATPSDYYKSGYDRGHLAPAADMSFSENAMDESFFMSNMSPQHPDLNRGLWLEMEKIEREWAQMYKSVYIVSGPVLNKENFETIGQNQVAVPEYFYKILVSYDAENQCYKYIAFLAPNATTNNQPYDFTTSVSQIENLTGIDFFPLLNDVVK